MERAFQFVEADSQVVPDSGTQLHELVSAIRRNTVRVETTERVGTAVFIGGSIVTSLVFMGKFRMAKVQIPKEGNVLAFVSAIDRKNLLVKLELSRSGGKKQFLDDFDRKLLRPKLVGHGDIGSPMLVANVRKKTSLVRVGGSQYLTRITPHIEDVVSDFWNIEPTPSRLIGGGVWSLDGRFAGLAIGQKPGLTKREFLRVEIASTQIRGWRNKVTPDEIRLLKRPRIYTAPAEVVLDFAETRN